MSINFKCKCCNVFYFNCDKSIIENLCINCYNKGKFIPDHLKDTPLNKVYCYFCSTVFEANTDPDAQVERCPKCKHVQSKWSLVPCECCGLLLSFDWTRTIEKGSYNRFFCDLCYTKIIDHTVEIDDGSWDDDDTQEPTQLNLFNEYMR